MAIVSTVSSTRKAPQFSNPRNLVRKCILSSQKSTNQSCLSCRFLWIESSWIPYQISPCLSGWFDISAWNRPLSCRISKRTVDLHTNHLKRDSFRLWLQNNLPFDFSKWRWSRWFLYLWTPGEVCHRFWATYSWMSRTYKLDPFW